MRLGLRPAGGNYFILKRRIADYQISTDHLKGHGWSRGMRIERKPKHSLAEVLVKNSPYPSYKLKRRLFAAGLKSPWCEECGWAQEAEDGRVPLELDHINGERQDNRLENLRILCPNCHSLKVTHRGLNIRKRQ